MMLMVVGPGELVPKPLSPVAARNSLLGPGWGINTGNSLGDHNFLESTWGFTGSGLLKELTGQK